MNAPLKRIVTQKCFACWAKIRTKLILRLKKMAVSPLSDHQPENEPFCKGSRKLCRRTGLPDWKKNLVGGGQVYEKGEKFVPPSHLSRLQQGYFRGGLDPTSVPNIIFLQAPEFSGK